MKKDMIWAFLIHLSRHLWREPGSPPHGIYNDKAWTDTNDVDLEVWDEVVSQLPQYGINMLVIDVGDAIQYDSHPEISAPDAWNKDFFRQKLAEIRALGMEPIPKLNFSTAHDIWMKGYGRMVSTPTYYQVCADLIRETCEIFDHPRLFHLGLDEETNIHQISYDLAVIRQNRLWEEDVEFLCAECEKNGARPWFWSSFAMRKHAEFIQNRLSRNAVMCAGWYNNPPPKDLGDKGPMFNPEFLDKMDEWGFDQISLSSTWSFKDSTQQVLRYSKDRLDPDRLLGFITAPWLLTEKRELHGLLHGACKLYYERQKIYPETIE